VFENTEEERERERERGATFNPTDGKKKRRRRSKVYIATKYTHSRKSFLGTNY
jgi:hypothetical protein